MATKVSNQMLKEGAAIPPGAVMSFAVSAAPVGWLACDGTAVSRAEYADLFTAVGTIYGVGNNSTTFNVPNLQGQFVRGLTTNQSTASRDPLSATRVLGNVQGDAIRNIVGEFKVAGATGGIDDVSGAFSSTNGQNLSFPAPVGSSINVGRGRFNASNVVPTAPENRPINIALLYCIKY